MRVVFTIIAVFLLPVLSFGQTGSVSTQPSDSVLSLEEFLAYVKLYHPVVRQANLEISNAQANLLQARGGFDPKIAVDYDRKDFKDVEYYDLLYGTFKIPTWFGIELQAGYELNEGTYLNPQNTVPEDGLYSAGVSVPIGRGLFINERMAALKQAKVFTALSQAERDLQVNAILAEAVDTYATWLRSYQELLLFDEFAENARIRLDGLKRRVEQGDLAAIDSVEARINFQTRLLNLEQAQLDLQKSRLNLANFLWIGNNIPLELESGIIPDINTSAEITTLLEINPLNLEDLNISAHPKVQSLQFKIQALEIERRLKAEQLKPRIDLNYNFITSDAEDLNTVNSGDYKMGLRFDFPLFLRKERGALKMAKFKIQDAELNRDQQTLALENKIEASRFEILNYQSQLERYEGIVTDYEQLLQAELRKFGFGESSVFLINSRESSLLSARIKQIELQWKLAKAQAGLFRQLGIPLDTPLPEDFKER